MEVNELTPNDGIHCKTFDEARRIEYLLHHLGYKWRDSKEYIPESRTEDYDEERQLVYFPADGTFDELEDVVDGDYILHDSKLFDFPFEDKRIATTL